MKSKTFRVVVAAAAVFAIASGVAYATGTLTSSAGVIHACQMTATGQLRVVSDSSACRQNETPISWNAEGPPGPPGPSGAPPAPHTQVVGQATIEGLNGNAPFPITGYSWGATSAGDSGTGTGGGAGKAIIGDVTIVHGVNSLSPALVDDAATGRHIRSAQIELFAPGTTTAYLRYELSDVLVTRVLHADDEETVALSPTEIDEALVAGAPTPTVPSDVGTVTFDGIAGTFAVSAHAFDVVNTGTSDSGSGGGAGKAIFKPSKVELALGAAAPTFAHAVLTGEHFRSAVVTMPHATYTLSDVLVPAVQDTATGAAGSVPTQAVDLTYDHVDVASR